MLKTTAHITGQLRVSAHARERANPPPFAEIELLRQGGLLEALEPREFGGGELSWPQALRIVREIASGETSITQLLGYHYPISRFVLLGGRPGQGPSAQTTLVEVEKFVGELPRISAFEAPLAEVPTSDDMTLLTIDIRRKFSAKTMS